jgi:hypothetical protein
MSNSKASTDEYQKLYVDLGFERGGLFELIQEKYHPKQVLYPGCSVHITPAFFFPHVVFVDQDPAAMAFFSNHALVLDLVKRHRKYRRTPYIQFISQDFTTPLPVPKNQFDLILALYTGGVSKACRSYLKIGGLLITNNHQNDAAEATQDNELALIAIVQKRQGKYRLVKEPSESLRIKNRASQSKRYLRQTSSGVEYIENESYYIFKRTRPRQ